jgi:hypothetical protein
MVGRTTWRDKVRANTAEVNPNHGQWRIKPTPIPATMTNNNHGMAGSKDSWKTHWGRERRGGLDSPGIRAEGKSGDSLGIAKKISEKEPSLGF